MQIPLVTAEAMRLAAALHLKLRPDVCPRGEKPVGLQELVTWRAATVTALWVAFVGSGALVSESAWAQAELTRKVKTRVSPTYPDLARRMSIRGTVKMVVVVSPNGNLKDARVVGGNPILVNAALDAVKKWKFEPAQDESTGTVEFNFQPTHTAE